MCDRLDELRFDFPIVGSDSHGRRDTLHAQLARLDWLWRSHRGPRI